MEKFDFVLNAWRLPQYPGLADHKGILRHSSHWNPTFDPTGKRVAVIGDGASGIQLMANLHRHVVRLDHYARNKTWVSASWAGDERTFEAQPISDEQKKLFEVPHAYLKFRKELEDKYWRGFGNFLKGGNNNELRTHFTEIMW